MNKGQSCFISAGEYSGDLLGRDLVNQIRSQNGDINFFGVGGSEMSSAGVENIVDISELNVMGFLEVFSKLPEIVRIEQQIIRDIEERNPEICVLIDFPGFHFRLAKRLKARGFKVVQYVAPKVWAWGQKRVHALAEDFDLVLGVLPFERDFFKKHNVNYKYVGSPHVDRVSDVTSDIDQLKLGTDITILGVLPGSRKSEIRRLVPEIKQVVSELESQAESAFEIKYVVPVAPSLNADFVVEQFTGISDVKHSLPCTVGKWTFVRGQSLSVMKASKAVLISSGTATLECGLIGTPMVVLYKLNFLSYLIAKLKVKLKWISLVNLSANEEVVPEFIQNIDHKAVAIKVRELLHDDSEGRKKMLGQLSKMREDYYGNAEQNAANEILSMMRGRDA